MNWQEYVKAESNRPTIFNNVNVSMRNSFTSGLIPLTVQLSVSILNKFLATGEMRIIFVFPEGKKLPFLFLISKLMYDAFHGSSVLNYDPQIFVLGAKLKFQNYVVEFAGIETEDGVTRICVRCKGEKNSIVISKCPIDSAPFFQQAETQRSLSKYMDFRRAVIEFERQRNQQLTVQGVNPIVEKLTNNITHYTSTLLSVVSHNRILELLDSAVLNGEKLSKLFLVGKANDEGDINICGSGQLIGNPAIVYSKDLYTALEAVQKDMPVKTIFIDGTDSAVINKQLDALDELIRLNFPIVYTTDTSNSLELEQLEARGFYIWRWDKGSITNELLSNAGTIVGNRINNCLNSTLLFVECASIELDNALSALLSCRQLAENATAKALEVYTKLLTIAFLCLRRVVDFNNNEKQHYLQIVTKCKEDLETEKRYLEDDLAKAMDTSIKELPSFICSEEDIPKVSQIKKCLLEHRADWRKVSMILSDDADKQQCLSFWQEFILKNHLPYQIFVVYQDEYVHDQIANYDATVICGWLRSEKMQRVLYSNISKENVTLLYARETSWKDGRLKLWNSILYKSDTDKVISRTIPELQLEHSEPMRLGTGTIPYEELDEISLVIQKAKYRDYIASGETKNLEDSVDAIPVNFVGNCFAFFKVSHELIDVTDIVLGKKPAIRMVFPESLNHGNFIVIREAARDIIRELADEILDNSRMSEYRAIASKWKESIKEKLHQTSINSLCERIKAAGCKKNILTIKQWMISDDRIIPQDKQDLYYIAVATEDKSLIEIIDSVYNAGRNVQSAHIKAGQALSYKLKKQIANKLTDTGIDPHNIWDPIPLQIDGIGNVKVLKVIDRGTVIKVDSSNVNRIFTSLER